MAPVVEITLIFWVFTTAEEEPVWLNEAVPKPLRSEAKEVPDSGLGISALTGWLAVMWIADYFTLVRDEGLILMGVFIAPIFTAPSCGFAISAVGSLPRILVDVAEGAGLGSDAILIVCSLFRSPS